jgi:hypothetical protein
MVRQVPKGEYVLGFRWCALPPARLDSCILQNWSGYVAVEDPSSFPLGSASSKNGYIV